MTNSTLEKVARALAAQAGCNPDDPAFVIYPGGEAVGVCWRDKFLEPAVAALQSLRQVDDETVEAMRVAAFNGRGLKYSFMAGIDHILTEGGEG